LNLLYLCAAAALLCTMPMALSAAQSSSSETQLEELQSILDGIDRRYAAQGFSASFFQASTLKALGITDTATGRLTVKRPDKMLWIYEVPEVQTIVTDGEHLWIHRPADNQVMLGSAPTFFKDGKGASFLTDTRQVREQFHVSQITPDRAGTWRLQLLPRKPQADIERILVTVDWQSFEIVAIVTVNSQGGRDAHRVQRHRLR
jgi:outer membrane lipoprotein carrier protein